MSELKSDVIWSPSRLRVANQCGLAYEYRYIRRLPAPYDRAAIVFGNVIHDALEVWYGSDEEPRDHREQDLVAIVCAQWADKLPPVIWEHVQALIELQSECAAVAAAVAFKRPTVKAPTQTKEYLGSEAAQAFSKRRGEMVGLCDRLDEMKWPKDEDPWKAYVKAAEIAAAMQRRWRPLPRPIVVERSFQIEFAGHMVRGRIDQIRMDPDRNTGEVWPKMRDVKSGRQPLTQMEAFLQAFLYSEAGRQDPTLPEFDDVGFYLARHDKYQSGRIDRARHAALASRILNGRATQIAQGQHEPSYGHWCKTCDFNDLCAMEISFWKGEGFESEPVVTG